MARLCFGLREGGVCSHLTGGANLFGDLVILDGAEKKGDIKSCVEARVMAAGIRSGAAQPSCISKLSGRSQSCREQQACGLQGSEMPLMAILRGLGRHTHTPGLNNKIAHAFTCKLQG